MTVKKDCGILLPVSALPSPYGIGDTGDDALRFVDFLAAAGQSYWQILPIGPTSYGDSPYQSPSAFAGNPYFISPDKLRAAGLLTEEECKSILAPSGKIDYAELFRTREPVLRAAYKRFTPTASYTAFVQNTPWLKEYALYCALKKKFGLLPWNEWAEEYRNIDSPAVQKFASENEDELCYTYFVQYMFFESWHALKKYANDKGIAIIGDSPIYLAYDSADVWAHKELFLLSGDTPSAVAGVPPDYFSEDGQKWGNPLYDWSNRDKVFAFWKERISHALTLFDCLRIDHFRAFADYYAVPTDSPTAKVGEWHDGPGKALFDYLESELGTLPILAEDLGELSEKARALPVACGFSGMKVVQFGLLGDQKSNAHALCNYTENFVGYTGTHDNDTALGWYSSLPLGQKLQVRRRLGLGSIPIAMIKRLYKSRVKTAIVPMQDFLKQGSAFRTNTPGTLGGNWRYRLTEIPSSQTATLIRKLAERYGRA